MNPYSSNNPPSPPSISYQQDRGAYYYLDRSEVFPSVTLLVRQHLQNGIKHDGQTTMVTPLHINPRAAAAAAPAVAPVAAPAPARQAAVPPIASRPTMNSNAARPAMAARSDDIYEAIEEESAAANALSRGPLPLLPAAQAAASASRPSPVRGPMPPPVPTSERPSNRANMPLPAPPASGDRRQSAGAAPYHRFKDAPVTYSSDMNDSGIIAPDIYGATVDTVAGSEFGSPQLQPATGIVGVLPTPPAPVPAPRLPEDGELYESIDRSDSSASTAGAQASRATALANAGRRIVYEDSPQLPPPRNAPASSLPPTQGPPVAPRPQRYEDMPPFTGPVAPLPDAPGIMYDDIIRRAPMSPGGASSTGPGADDGGILYEDMQGGAGTPRPPVPLAPSTSDADYTPPPSAIAQMQDAAYLPMSSAIKKKNPYEKMAVVANDQQPVTVCDWMEEDFFVSRLFCLIFP